MQPQHVERILADVLVERWGLSLHTADAVGRLVTEVSRMQAEALLADFLRRVKNTRAGTAMLIALGDEEPLREHARRLKCDPGALARLVGEYERALQDAGNGRATLNP